MDKKTFTIHKYGTTFQMLQYFDSNFKVENFKNV